jgi:copper chaperone CopZ
MRMRMRTQQFRSNAIFHNVVVILLLLSSSYNTKYHHQVYSFSLSRTTATTVSTTSLLLFKKRRRTRTRTGSNENIKHLFSSHHKKKNGDLNSNNNSMLMTSSLGVRGGAAANVDEAKKEGEKNVVMRNNSKSYYLIWSPGFIKQFLIAMTIILTTIRCCSFYNISKWGGWGANFNIVTISTPFISNIILPLLSSSCCAIQLTINALSSIFLAGTGCVGFNSTLGPIRPYLLAITMIVYNYTNPFFRSLSSSSPSVLSLLLLRYTIVFMPELVYWWNSILRSRWKRQKNTTTTTNGNTNKKQDTENSSTDKLLRATLVFDVPTMGCVACVNKIESSLRQSTVLKDYIASTDSWLVKNAKDGDNNNGSKSGGFAKIDICVESEKELDDVINNVVIAIEGAGFRGTTIKSKLMMNDDDHKASN